MLAKNVMSGSGTVVGRRAAGSVLVVVAMTLAGCNAKEHEMAQTSAQDLEVDARSAVTNTWLDAKLVQAWTTDPNTPGDGLASVWEFQFLSWSRQQRITVVTWANGDDPGTRYEPEAMEGAPASLVWETDSPRAVEQGSTACPGWSTLLAEDDVHVEYLLAAAAGNGTVGGGAAVWTVSVSSAAGELVLVVDANTSDAVSCA